MPNRQNELELSVVIAVVSGKNALRRCLKALTEQADFAATEINVPFDKWSKDIIELAPEFPAVRFYFIENLGIADCADIAAHRHRLYDRRRAAGLEISKGRIVAMTEDHAVPSPEWCGNILEAHRRQSAAAIGGAVENEVDSPLNWAWYYCDFGRYGRPLEDREIEYVSDVNVSYKRAALTEIKEIWRDAYQETSVHWALCARGKNLLLDEKIVVFQHRPKISLRAAWLERIEWGRVFAETRAARSSLRQRFLYAAGTPFLPLLLLARAVKNMRRQKRTVKLAARVLPLVFFLLTGWAVGEFSGYVAGQPQRFPAKKTGKFARAGLIR